MILILLACQKNKWWMTLNDVPMVVHHPYCTMFQSDVQYNHWYGAYEDTIRHNEDDVKHANEDVNDQEREGHDNVDERAISHDHEDDRPIVDDYGNVDVDEGINTIISGLININ